MYHNINVDVMTWRTLYSCEQTAYVWEVPTYTPRPPAVAEVNVDDNIRFIELDNGKRTGRELRMSVSHVVQRKDTGLQILSVKPSTEF